ncbi:MAG: FAD:protein FMN transferase [Terriglobales bacterium]
MITTSIEGEALYGGSEGLVRFEGGSYCMGTMFNIVAYGSHREQLELAITEALAEARRLDGMLSNYRPESELSQLNRVGSQGPVNVSSEFFQFLLACHGYSEASEGAFDITVGPLLNVSGFYKGAGRLPRPEQILQAFDKVGYKNIILDEQNMTVRLAQEGMELDPGGIGKGFAVDKMAEILKHHQVHSALISAGGSTIYGLGAPPNQPGWEVTIKDPRKPSQTAETVRLKDEAISTSGNYEKFIWADDKIWGHIMDPRTGYPAKGTLAVSVIAPRTVDSEAWTKPYFILGRAWIERNKSSNFRVFYCQDEPSIPCAWL